MPPPRHSAPRLGPRPVEAGGGDPDPSTRRSTPHAPLSSRPSRPSRRAGWVALLAAAVIVLVVAAVTISQESGGSPAPSAAAAPNLPPPPPPDKVIASIPYWNLGAGTASVVANRTIVDEVSPWTYGIAPDAGITSNVPPENVADATAAMNQLRTLGIPLMPSVSNMVDGDWDYSAVASMLHDQSLMDRNVSAITQLAVSRNYAGIDLDYEELHGDDRDAFSHFVGQLADSLHAAHKQLSVAVFAKVDDAGDDQRNVAQDYAAIGAAADQVRLMTYDYHWETSPPGPISPSTWVRDVLAYATSVIPTPKLVLGLDMAGYDWVGDQAQPITYDQATGLARSHGATVQFDPLSRSPWFRYTDQKGTHHEVWFENEASVAAKRSVAAAAGVRTVFLWMYGPPDPAVWTGLRTPTPSGGTR